MPSLSAVPLRRQRSEDDESEEGSNTSDQATPSSPKRRRLRAGSSEESDSEDADDAINGVDNGEGASTQAQANLTNGVRHPSTAKPTQNGHRDDTGPGGFKPGAIVRVKLTDFVTYTSAEFFPGPKLNMVIGPNGTGKSTLVCAICLGLGWGPQVCRSFSSMYDVMLM